VLIFATKTNTHLGQHRTTKTTEDSYPFSTSVVRITIAPSTRPNSEGHQHLVGLLEDLPVSPVNSEPEMDLKNLKFVAVGMAN
jgi:hypothetical protein